MALQFDVTEYSNSESLCLINSLQKMSEKCTCLVRKKNGKKCMTGRDPSHSLKVTNLQKCVSFAAPFAMPPIQKTISVCLAPSCSSTLSPFRLLVPNSSSFSDYFYVCSLRKYFFRRLRLFALSACFLPLSPFPTSQFSCQHHHTHIFCAILALLADRFFLFFLMLRFFELTKCVIVRK